MAQIKDNIITKGITGKIGNQLVFRQVGNKTIIASKPHRKPTTHPTLIGQNNRFKLASAYAKAALANPILKEQYPSEAKKRGIINPYNMAISDFMKNPEISHINTSAYNGTQINQPINITVTDNFKVIAITVTITHQNNTIEEGNATLNNGIWQYHTTTLNPHISNTKITITATDRPQNQTTQEIIKE